MDKTDEQILDNIIERDYRKKSQWYSFTSQVWGFLGMASFLSTLSTFVTGVITAASTSGAVAEKAIEAAKATAEAAGTTAPAVAPATTLATAVLTNPWAWAAMAGLMVVGLVSTWLSQREATELRILQDEHMAYQNAKSMSKARGKAKEIEKDSSSITAPVITPPPLNPLVPEPIKAKPTLTPIVTDSAPTRLDGKKWEEFVRATAPEAGQRIH